MKKLIYSGLLTLSLVAGFSQSTIHAQENKDEKLSQALRDYKPTQIYHGSSEIKFGIKEDKSNEGKNEGSFSSSAELPAAIGRTYVDREGFRFYGSATSMPTSYVIMIGVHGYLGREPRGGSVRWYDDEDVEKWFTRDSTAAVYLGEDVSVGAAVGDSVICQALHTVTNAFGTFTAESADVMYVNS